MNVIHAVGATKSLRTLAEKVAWYCIFELDLARYRTLEIEIKLNKCLNDGAYGFCYEGENDRDFTIEIDKRIPKMPEEITGYKDSRDAFIETLCHEMVHVMQTAKGTLADKFHGGYKRMWKGKDYTGTPYSRRPWERQAYRMQGKLKDGYLECVEGKSAPEFFSGTEKYFKKMHNKG